MKITLSDTQKTGFLSTRLICNKSTFTVPEERGVIAKERTAGSYRLSAYYLAKTVSELPLHIVGPIPYYTFVYWMAGLGDVAQFFSTLSILLLATITAQVRLQRNS